LTAPKYVPRKRTLTDEELKKVWYASYKVPDPFGPIVRMLVLTGARKMEVATLKWSYLNGGITFPETKNDHPRTIPYTGMMKTEIEKQPRLNSTQYIFPGRTGKPYNGWGKHKALLDKKTGNAPHSLHDLRRTFAHNWQRMGAKLEVTEAALGHIGSRGGIVGIYQTYDYAEELKDYYSRWEQRLTTILTAPA
jgi:integrase